MKPEISEINDPERASVLSQKFIVTRGARLPSFPRKRESSVSLVFSWIPALARIRPLGRNDVLNV